MRLVAFAVSAWAAWRWLGFLVGVVRIRSFEGPVRREARRTVVNRGAINMFLSIVALYLWVTAFGLDMTDTFVGFLSACLMCSLAVGVASAFMQPEERTPDTLEICRVLTRRTPARPT